MLTISSSTVYCTNTIEVQYPLCYLHKQYAIYCDVTFCRSFQINEFLYLENSSTFIFTHPQHGAVSQVVLLNFHHKTYFHLLNTQMMRSKCVTFETAPKKQVPGTKIW
jgi:hypothetical protein